jgi:hypothetical protein
MSNHWHLVVTDPQARLPEFMHLAHQFIAKCINASHGRWENLWASEPPSAVKLIDHNDVLDKISYCLTNPVTAGLVDRGSEWPGLHTGTSAVGRRSMTFERPRIFFREQGPMPEVATLQLHRPPIYPEQSDDDIARLVSETVAAREATTRAEVIRKGRTFLGVEAIHKQRPWDRPSNAEPRRGLSPRVACHDKWRRFEALRRFKAFLAAYRAAFLSWKSGLRDVVFPLGCYAMRIHQSVPVADSS